MSSMRHAMQVIFADYFILNLAALGIVIVVACLGVAVRLAARQKDKPLLPSIQLRLNYM